MKQSQSYDHLVRLLMKVPLGLVAVRFVTGACGGEQNSLLNVR